MRFSSDIALCGARVDAACARDGQTSPGDQLCRWRRMQSRVPQDSAKHYARRRAAPPMASPPAAFARHFLLAIVAQAPIPESAQEDLLEVELSEIFKKCGIPVASALQEICRKSPRPGRVEVELYTARGAPPLDGRVHLAGLLVDVALHPLDVLPPKVFFCISETDNPLPVTQAGSRQVFGEIVTEAQWKALPSLEGGTRLLTHPNNTTLFNYKLANDGVVNIWPEVNAAFTWDNALSYLPAVVQGATHLVWQFPPNAPWAGPEAAWEEDPTFHCVYTVYILPPSAHNSDRLYSATFPD